MKISIFISYLFFFGFGTFGYRDDSNRQTHFINSLGVSKDSFENNIKVAIIGAGAAGSSAAYFLKRYSQKNFPNLTLDIDIYEKSGRVGGRVLPQFFGDEHDKIEMGAGAFVETNQNMMTAAKDFNISIKDFINKASTYGIFNGKDFVELNDNSLVNRVAFYYRYGWGIGRATSFANTIKDLLAKGYDESLPAFKTVEEFLSRTELLSYLFKTSKEVLVDEWSAGPVYTDELFSSISRSSYGMDSSIHSLAGGMSLLAGWCPYIFFLLIFLAYDAFTAENGNDAFFKHYIDNSNANIHLNSQVTKITRIPGDSKDLVWHNYQLEIKGEKIKGVFDAVIFATPFHLSGIQIENLEVKIPLVEYRQIHIAVIEEAIINPSFFNSQEGTPVPDMIYSFNSSFPFTFISHNSEKRRITVESTEPITSETLAPLLLHSIDADNLTIMNWQAYPVMKTLDKNKRHLFPPLQLGPSLYYTNAIEPALSCMEVEIMSARNIARLVLDEIAS